LIAVYNNTQKDIAEQESIDCKPAPIIAISKDEIYEIPPTDSQQLINVDIDFQIESETQSISLWQNRILI